MRNFVFILIVLLGYGLHAQEKDTLRLDFKEYLSIVKKYHPLVKQAELIVDEGDFKLLKSRGYFDPKIEGDIAEKNYKSTEYYNLFGAAFKIPTYYGLELNAKYEKNSGKYLNPQNSVPEDGLYSAGVSLDVNNGIFLSERMATLKQARIYQEQSQVKRDLVAAEILYNAAKAYFDWYASHQKLLLYQEFFSNAEFRFQSVKTAFRAGDKPAVDTLEANINVNNRELELQQARLDYVKASLQLSNYLWTQNNIPLEITDEVKPVENLFERVNEMWFENDLMTTESIQENPKIRFLKYDVAIKEVEKRLKVNKLLPNLDLSYNFLTNQPENWQKLNTEDYKFGFKFSLPIFMRKERGELQLAKLELENSRYDLLNANQEIQNKLKSLKNEIVSYLDQRFNMNNLVDAYASLLAAEHRKFELGDSSVFLINSRENSFISAKIKEIEVIGKYLKSHAELLKLTTNF